MQAQRYYRCEAVVPHATDPLPEGAAQAIYVGGTGTVVADCGAADVTFLAVPIGTTIEGYFKAIRATSTATGIIAIYAR